MKTVQFGVSYFGVRDLRHVCEDLDEIADAGFSTITHTLSEYDLRYHQDDVPRIVEESKKRGLEVVLDPWGVGGIFGGEAWSELALVDLDSRQVDAEGVSVPASCPHAPATKRLLERWTTFAIQAGADALFWDEPHFYLGALRSPPHAPCCRCRHCHEAFRKLYAGETALPAEGDPRLTEFRSLSISQLLRDLLALSANSPVKQTLCLLPFGLFLNAGTDDWERFATIPGWDRLATDPYWMDRPLDVDTFVGDQTRKLQVLAQRTQTELEIWIQGIRIPRGDESKITCAVEAAVREGASRVAFWSFRGTDRMSWLACEDANSSWQAMKEAVRRFSV